LDSPARPAFAMREPASSGLIVMPHALTRRRRDAQLEIFVPELGTKSPPTGFAHLQNSIRVYDLRAAGSVSLSTIPLRAPLRDMVRQEKMTGLQLAPLLVNQIPSAI
jgi:hypothetical protein